MRDTDPTAKPSSEQLDEQFEKANLDQAISDALDGYAPDSESWTAAYKTFYADLHDGVAPEHALGHALEVAEEGAESTREEAQERFWSTATVEKPVDYDKELHRAVSRDIDTLLASPSAKRYVGENFVSDSYTVSSELVLRRTMNTDEDYTTYSIDDRRGEEATGNSESTIWDEGSDEVTQVTRGRINRSHALEANEKRNTLAYYESLISDNVSKENAKSEKNRPGRKKKLVKKVLTLGIGGRGQ